MATFSYQALIFENDMLGDPVAVSTGLLSISTPWPLVDLFYFEPGNNDNTNVGGLTRATVRVNGDLVSQGFGFDTALYTVRWGNQTAILFEIEVDDRSFIIQVAGDPVPVSDLASLQAFEALNPTFGQVTSGDWLPGNGIEWDPTFLLGGLSGLVGYSENDDYVNTAANTGSSQGRFRMREGDDRFTGNDWREEVYGGDGNDTLSGNGSSDTIYGEAGNDQIFGGVDFDSLYGGDGDDSMDGGAGFDVLYGGIGRDTMSGGDGADEVFGDEGNDRLAGGPGADVLWGQVGADTLQGDFGNDWLHGGDGNDHLTGGRGNDQLTGGQGADRFIFWALFGQDAITDFSAAQGDVLFFQATMTGGNRTLTDAQVLSTYATDLGDAVRFDFGGGQIVTLFGVSTLAELDGHITLF
jgi:Ca2+-binding RTX toxin-like protein